jgi:hypothetical protein
MDTAIDNITRGLQVTTRRDDAHHDEILTYFRTIEGQAGEVLGALRIHHGEAAPQVQRVAQEIASLVGSGTAHHQEIVAQLFGQDYCFQ